MHLNRSSSIAANAIAATLASMLIHVAVKKESAHVHFKGWSDSFADAVLTGLHFIEVCTLATNAELRFVYLDGTVEVLGVDYRCFGGKSLHDPDVQIARVYLWDDATEAPPELICWQPAIVTRGLKLLQVVTATPENAVAEVTITSNGPLIVTTNFWASKIAQCGGVGVSMLEGHLRILVPNALRPSMLGVSPVEDWLVVALPTDNWRMDKPCMAFIFPHGDQDFWLIVTPKMFIGPPPDFSEGAKVPLSLWVSENGKPRCAALRPAIWMVVPEILPKQ